jgi:LmbE family N-acetylglucosaminyl deacetylase
VLESDIIPYHLSSPPGERIVVLAPHPDDETLGCGGTIRLLSKSGKRVKIIFLTSGDQADPSNPASKIHHGEEHITDYSILREREAIQALKVLGVSDYEFLRFPDRKLDLHFEGVLCRLLDILRQYAADVLCSPSMIELNPDHRAAAAMAMEIQKTGDSAKAGVVPLALLFYEVTTPLRPNVLIDITSTRDRKRKAVKRYKSQLGITDYLKYITALNEVRSLTVREAEAVEAFWLVESPLRSEEITGWLAYQTSVSKNTQGRS